MKKVGQTSEFLFGKLLKCANKKQNNFNIYNFWFLKKRIKKNTCRYNYQNLDDMIYSSWDTEKNILKLGILGHFLPFICPFGVFPKNQNQISLFYTCVPKLAIIWWTVPEIQSETGIIFCHFGPLFALLPHPLPLRVLKIKILKKKKKKKEKNTWRYYPFIHTCAP